MIEGVRIGRHTEVIAGIDQGDHYEFCRSYNCRSTMAKSEVGIYFMPEISKAAGQPGQQEPTA